VLACAALAVCIGAFGTAARGVAYSIPFDPPFTFAGVVTIDIDISCLTPFPDVHNCLVDFLSADFTDTAGDHWGSSGTDSQLDLVAIDASGQLTALEASLSPPFLVFLGKGGNPCDGGPTLSFDLSNGVSFSCSGVVNDTGTYKVVPAPEPATLTLLGLGLAGLVAARRRKLK